MKYRNSHFFFYWDSVNCKRMRKNSPVIISTLINCSSIERIFRSLFSTTMSPTKGSWGRHSVFFMCPLIIKSGIRSWSFVWLTAEPSSLTKRFFCIRKSPHFLDNSSMMIFNDLLKIFMSHSSSNLPWLYQEILRIA